MRFFRESPPGAFLEVSGDITVGATHIPFGNLASWSEAERASVGVVGVPEPVAPAGQIVASWHVARVDGVVQAVATFAPEALPALTFLQFITLFSSPEQGAIVDSADTNVRIFLAEATGAQFIDLNDGHLAAGLAYLVQIGILAARRPGQILKIMAPA